MVTKNFTPEDITRLGPGGVEAAIRAADLHESKELKTGPKNLQQAFKTVSSNGDRYLQPETAQIIDEAGQVPIYHLQTGLRHYALKNLLPAKLRELDTQNRIVWTTDPDKAPTPIKPTYPCMLSKDHEMRPLADTMGFKTCDKMLFTQQDVIDHTKKHEKAWAAFERNKIETKEAKTEKWQETSMTAITSAALNAPSQQSIIEKACSQCGESLFATNLESVDIKLAVHMKQHGTAFTTGETDFTTDETDVLQEVFSTVPLVSDEGQKEHIAPDPAPSPEQERMLSQVKNFPGWCPQPNCDFVTDAKSASGAKTSLGHHRNKEHSDA